MKNVFFFSGLDRFDIQNLRSLYFWNKFFQDEVSVAEKSIGQGSFIKKALIKGNLDSFYENIDLAYLIFNISQVSLAKSLEKKIGKPDMLLTHSLGEISSYVYNGLVSYNFLWDFYKITMPFCQMMGNKSYKNLMVFGDPNDLDRFIQASKLEVMSLNSMTSALLWLGDRQDIDKKFVKSYNISSLVINLLSYPIHTHQMTEAINLGLKKLFNENIFEKHKNSVLSFEYPLLSSTKYKVVDYNDLNSLDKIATVWAELCRTPMNLTKTYSILKSFYALNQFKVFTIEYSNTFVSALRENDPEGFHASGLLESTQTNIKLLGHKYLIQDLGLYSKIGDSLGFLR